MAERFTYLRDATQLLNWAKDLVRTLNQFYASTTGVPSGLQAYWHEATPPLGWLASDGSSQLTTKYPTLFVAIAYTYGGSGANFNLPPAQTGKFPIIKV